MYSELTMNDLPPTDPVSTPLAPAAVKKEVQAIEDPTVGLALQFVVAAMLSQGIIELRLTKELLEQAMSKLITAEALPNDEGFIVRIFRE